jgi:hypothetical protein
VAVGAVVACCVGGGAVDGSGVTAAVAKGAVAVGRGATVAAAGVATLNDAGDEAVGAAGAIETHPSTSMPDSPMTESLRSTAKPSRCPPDGPILLPAVPR